MRLGFIGTGKIASSVITGICNSKISFKKILVSPRNRNIAQRLKRKFRKVSIAKNNQEIVNSCNWVFLAVTPKVGKKIIPNLKFRSNQKVISFIATINLAQLRKAIGKKVKIVRAIPLPPISIRKGPVPICPPDKQVKSFFNKLGIKSRTIYSGDNKLILDPFHELTPKQYSHVKKLTDQIHTQFINDLKESRSNKLSENDSIYSGLFYTGSEALSLGLIDGLSSLYDLKSDRYDNLPIQKYNRDNDILNQILKTSLHYLSQLNLN